MKTLNLIDHFNISAGEFGFIATYDFDPQFFEKRILTKRLFGSADRLIIFMDGGRYRELVRKGLRVSGFNRRYLVAPMGGVTGVFHPKLYLAFGKERVDGLVGSNNCTSAGFAYNVELCSAFSLFTAKVGSNHQETFSLIRQIYDVIKTYTADAGVLRNVIEDEFLKPVEGRYPWLHSSTVVPKAEAELLSSYGGTLWSTLTERLAGKIVSNICIIAPFFDRELGFLEQLRKHWPNAALTVVAQPEYATLVGKKLARLFNGGHHRLLSARPLPGRRLHAKAFAFETDSGTYWLSGSPNATVAAFNGRNVEAALWVGSRENVDKLLKSSGISLEESDPIDFQGSDDFEVSHEIDEPADLVLESAILTESGKLNCQLEGNQKLQDFSVSVRNTSTVWRP